MTVLAHTPLLAESGPFSLFVSAVLLMLGVAVLIGLVMVARKYVFNGDADGANEGLTIGGLRDLVRQGKMTQDEFDRTKAQLVAHAQRKAEREAMEVKPDGLNPRGGVRRNGLPPGSTDDDDDDDTDDWKGDAPKGRR